ncbi:MAG: hypothetical protein KGO94_13830 [Alphaproteobacteria bacterium]|nr:hypothetical protein [Alphaproteobacteria bacterium]
MTILNSSQPSQNPLAGIIRSVLGNRFGLLAVGAVVLGLGAYSSWGWLVAAGIAPLLLSLAPCAAMCAVGMCAMGGKKNDQANSAASGTLAAPGARSPLNLAAPGAIEGTYSVVDKPAGAKAKGKHDCC